MTLHRSFAYFGARVANSRWSRSARRDDQPTVIVALWQDLFRVENGRLIYEIDDEEAQCNSRGARERWFDLRWAIEHCLGLVRVVIVVAHDRRKRKRSIAKSFPHKALTMKIASIDDQTRKFRLEAI